MPNMGSGPTSTKIMLVGDFYSDSDVRSCEPLSGTAGQELNRMLHEAGIMRSECYCTNVVNARPPEGDLNRWVAKAKKDITPQHVEWRGKFALPIVRDGCARLLREIALIQPHVIITLGALPLFALTGAWGADKWRGSQLRLTHPDWTGIPPKVIPTLHPSAILRQWENRAACVTDLRRAAAERGSIDYHNEPMWNFQVRPSFPQVQTIITDLMSRLDQSPLWIDFDLETRAGHIACAGISWSPIDALCIPLMCVEHPDGYWSLDEEAALVHLLYRLLTHPNVLVRGQNLLYDCQYTYRHWHWVPRVAQDTMISHHTLFAGLPKSLAYQASIYCKHYIYWKDDGKTWAKDVGEDQLWAYNCMDCVRTREVGEASAASLTSLGLAEVDAFQQRLFWPVLYAMQRGVRIDKAERARFALTLQDEQIAREEFFKTVLGHPFNPNSSPQMVKLFYQDLALPPIRTRAKKGVPAHLTCDDKALVTLMQKEPLTRPIIRAIQEYRSLGVFLSTFVCAPLDTDDRMRCSYNICGTETYRFNSSKNAFGSGTNLQNVPKGGEEDGLTLPNIRTLFIPDPGYTFFDTDLDRADLQVVVWEADDPDLKAALRMGVDMHLLNAYTLAAKEPPPLEELVEGHPRYLDHRIPFKKERQLAKSFIHGTNYGGGARTMAAAAGVTVHQADKFQHLYFSRYPGLKAWHERTHDQLTKHRFVENKFGYRRYYFDRTDGLLPEALAWIPQCLPTNHQVLTPEGWTSLAQVDETTPIAIWAPSGAISFEVPSQWNWGVTDKLINMKGLGYLCTPNHRVPYYNAGRDTLQVTTADRLPSAARIPRCGMYCGGTLQLSRALVQFIVALQADGHYDASRDCAQFEFQRERKVDRLTAILKELGVPYSKSTVRRDATLFYVPHVSEFVSPTYKYFSQDLLTWTSECLDWFLEELTYWDGYTDKNGVVWYSSSTKTNCEWVATIATLRGKRARWMSSDARSESPNYRITIAPNKGKRSSVKPQSESTPGLIKVGCPTVSTGFFLVKKGDEISVTGNSTVANYINRVWVRLFENAPHIQVLLQVHDSLCGQFPSHRKDECIATIKREAQQVAVPYPDPLIIPVGTKTSTKSWGDCE